MAINTALAQVKALTFDVFGTVVDWRGSIIREGARLNASKGLTRRLGAIRGRMARRVRAVDEPRAARRTAVDGPRHSPSHVARSAARPLSASTDLTEDEKADLSRVWHRLDPWPDSAAGLARLRERFIVATLSNGSVALLVDIARFAGLDVGLHPLGGTGAGVQARSGRLPDGGRAARLRAA